AASATWRPWNQSATWTMSSTTASTIGMIMASSITVAPRSRVLAVPGRPEPPPAAGTARRLSARVGAGAVAATATSVEGVLDLGLPGLDEGPDEGGEAERDPGDDRGDDDPFDRGGPFGGGGARPVEPHAE